MKKCSFLAFITLLLLPAFTPWLPHSAVHALHDHQESHHQSRTDANDEHSHAEHDHNIQTQASDHHSIGLDAVTYFSEYLHVDLQNVHQATLIAPMKDSQDIDLTFTANLIPEHRYELTFVQSRAPPDWSRHRPDNTPLYLSTQRLRI